MPNTSLLPFETAQRAAETLSDPRVRSQLLAELAQQQLATEQFDDAIQTFAAIPLPLERRIALLVADFQNFPPEKVESLLKILTMDAQTQQLAGRLALAMLEAKNVRAAWKIVERDKDAFETEDQQFEFLEKILPMLHTDDWDKILRLRQTFSPGFYQDGVSFALVKYLAENQRADETERFFDLFSTPVRKAWAYWKTCQLVPKEQSIHYFDKAIETAEAIGITTDDKDLMETLATVLRIFGCAAFEKDREQGERLLERSESAAATLTVPIQRYRLQCFLGKVLLELKQIESVQEYLPIDMMLESLPSALNRSRVSVWLAEAGWSEGWSKAVAVLSAAERGVDESDRAERISEVIKRFAAHHRELKATGDSVDDASRISSEEFESYYFDPFVERSCGC